jgi:hypothetical protein
MAGGATRKGGSRVPILSGRLSDRRAWFMKTWDVRALEAASRAPRVLSSTPAARVVVLQLLAGQSLHDHEVHERAWLVVVTGEIAVKSPGDPTAEGGPGTVFEFAPQERREIFAACAARLLLFLAPWPGDGHPGALSDAQRIHARARAAAHERERIAHESGGA